MSGVFRLACSETGIGIAIPIVALMFDDFFELESLFSSSARPISIGANRGPKLDISYLVDSYFLSSSESFLLFSWLSMVLVDCIIDFSSS